VHRERLDRLAAELHRPVERPVDPHLADRAEDQILAPHPPSQRPPVDEPDGVRHPQPHLPGRHRRGEIGAPDPCREGAERPVGAGVAVCADHEVAGDDDPLLGEEGVLDPGAAHVEVVREPLFPGELPEELRMLGRLDVLVGGEMVGHEDDARRVEDAPGARLPELLDRDRGGDVVAEGDVHRGHHDLARRYRPLPRVRREDLLDDGHSHCRPSPRPVRTRFGRSISDAELEIN